MNDQMLTGQTLVDAVGNAKAVWVWCNGFNTYVRVDREEALRLLGHFLPGGAIQPRAFWDIGQQLFIRS